jgi:hypothetical protein
MGSLYNLFNEYIDSLGLYVEKKAEKKLSKTLIRKWDDGISEIVAAFQNVSFEIGFILGQMFDVGDPEVENYIKILVKEMKEKRAFPLFPRQHNKGRQTLPLSSTGEERRKP